jgi:hypothetical protein
VITDTEYYDRISDLVDRTDIDPRNPGRMSVLRLGRILALGSLRQTPRRDLHEMADRYPDIKAKAVTKALTILEEIKR